MTIENYCAPLASAGSVLQDGLVCCGHSPSIPMPNRIAESSWYDHPRYYDIAFASETQREADFIEAACRKYCRHEVRRLLEPACGTGRLLAEMAARGYRMTGLDLSEPSLDYLRRRLARGGLRATVVRRDMAEFHLARPVDAAYCMINSFRHLLDEASARSHLQCVADSLRPGGIYILGFHLLPLDADEQCTERWTERQGRTQVSVTLRVLATDRPRRIENLRVCLLVREGKRVHRLRHEFPFRMYTAAQFRCLLRQVPSLELCDVYDFWYEIDRPAKLSEDCEDSVFILRKREE